MADIERQDNTQQDIEKRIAEVRAQRGEIDAEAALNILVRTLKHSNGYYTWSPLGERFDQVWLYRGPRMDLDDEAWMSEEKAELLHICRPVKYLTSVEEKDKQGGASYSGYVRDSDNKTDDEKNMRCCRCKREMPEELAKKGIIQLKLHKLGQAR